MICERNVKRDISLLLLTGTQQETGVWECTDGVHDSVSQHNVADVDSGDEADKTRDNIRVVHIYRLSYGLEAK